MKNVGRYHRTNRFRFSLDFLGGVAEHIVDRVMLHRIRLDFIGFFIVRKARGNWAR